MGSACCVAARDKTIPSNVSNEVIRQNLRYSPTWSFRWENRGRVAGEEASVGWFSDEGIRGNGLDIRYENAYASEDGSSLNSFQRRMWPKSPLSERNVGQLQTPASDRSISRNISMDASLEQVELKESPAASFSSPLKTSPSSLPSSSSLFTPPLSSHHQPQPACSTPSKWSTNLVKQPLHQGSESRLTGSKSPNNNLAAEERSMQPSWSNESTRGSYGGSSDSWSVNAFSELVASSHGGTRSFDGDIFGSNLGKISKSSSRMSASTSADPQTCGVCAKLLTERSSWSSQKIIASNELSVVAVLICGHVYHAECLETMTPDVDKYDPSCPICTFGEKRTLKMSEKILKAESDLKIRKGKKSRNQVVDSDLDGDFVVFDRVKGTGHEGKSFKMASSSSMKSSSSKPFLRRHFSFGSKANRSLSENHCTRKKGFFWSRSSKE